ncbi:MULTISPECIES: glycosyltransferase family 2 protein [Sphingobacterium]|uniref:glycosyltransferase family 2 protein n=1 Tax=Sphingobacterium TaxID=28453 RepID=UPI00257C6461|nr:MULTISPECIES: glycosyltransferase family 2 protein [Sphingobacterium]
MVDVSIILVNYNTYELVLSCISSIKEKTSSELKYEIIIVDNMSQDRNIENVTNLFSDVLFVQSSSNRGFGSGNNLGVLYAKGSYVLFLNTDTLLINDAVSILYSYMKNNEKVGVCGANLYSKEGEYATSFSQIPPSLLADFDYLFFNIFSKLLYRNCVNYNVTNSPIRVRGTISGACYMVSRNVFNKIGGFDEDFFMYYEETELSHRIMRSGLKLINHPEAKVIHLEGGSEQVKSRALDWTLESKLKFFNKTGRFWQYHISNLVNYVVFLQRFFLFKLINNREKIAYWKSMMKWANSKFFKNK